MNQLDLNGKSLLITGGTGSFGKAFTRIVLDKWPKIRRLVIFSRDEQKQYQMQMEYPERDYPMLRFFIGDVRDGERLKRAFKDIEFVIHAAAMKHVHIAEYNPDECVKTNVFGAENVIQAAMESDVRAVVALSTDKACAPINLYGATKLTSDKLFIAANNVKGKRDLRFAVVRYGNVMGSNGSVMPYFLKEASTGVLKITHPDMTRFNISLTEGVELVLDALANCWGGELYVPKIPSYRILDVAKAIAPDCRIEEIGIRPGEKIHEEMITVSDSFSTYDLGDRYVILPQVNYTWKEAEFVERFKATKVPAGFYYNSGENTAWLSVQDLRRLIRLHVDPAFTLE